MIGVWTAAGQGVVTGGDPVDSGPILDRIVVVSPEKLRLVKPAGRS
jgi:hypothetical protein